MWPTIFALAIIQCVAIHTKNKKQKSCNFFASRPDIFTKHVTFLFPRLQTNATFEKQKTKSLVIHLANSSLRPIVTW
jgi:hypothetical protein